MSNSVPPLFERSQFRKSTFSGQNPQASVEVAREDGWVAIRDSKRPWSSTEDHHLMFTAEQFDAWLAAACGETAEEMPCIDITRREDGVNVFRSTVPQSHSEVLTFTDLEVAAFLKGVRDREFD